MRLPDGQHRQLHRVSKHVTLRRNVSSFDEIGNFRCARKIIVNICSRLLWSLPGTWGSEIHRPHRWHLQLTAAAPRSTRLFRQDFDEKRAEWRRQRRSLLNTMAAMRARALRFEDKERETIALYALEYYMV